MRRKWLSAVLAAGLTVAAAATFFAFAPTGLGGQVTYITVTGSSMEPGLSNGDLVLARERPSYATGDVVVYRHPDLGFVIHRVIGRDGATFVLQGDNNDFVDGEQPAMAEIAGEQWMTVPGAGRWLAYLKAPFTFGVLIFVAAFALLWGEERRPRNRRRKWAQRAPAETSSGVLP